MDTFLLSEGESVNNRKFESCDLRTDTIRIKSNTTKHFYRCESKRG